MINNSKHIKLFEEYTSLTNIQIVQILFNVQRLSNTILIPIAYSMNTLHTISVNLNNQQNTSLESITQYDTYFDVQIKDRAIENLNNSPYDIYQEAKKNNYIKNEWDDYDDIPPHISDEIDNKLIEIETQQLKAAMDVKIRYTLNSKERYLYLIESGQYNTFKLSDKYNVDYKLILHKKEMGLLEPSDRKIIKKYFSMKEDGVTGKRFDRIQQHLRNIEQNITLKTTESPKQMKPLIEGLKLYLQEWDVTENFKHNKL